MQIAATDSIGLLMLFFLLGLAVGSFLNVLALRTLASESILWQPSHCPKCMQRLVVYDNIPILSYLFLGGKCRHCHKLISWQYPVVELITGVVFVFLFKTFGLNWYLLGMLVFVSTLIAVSVTDMLEKLIPHDITYPSMLLGLLFSALIRKDFLGAMVGISASYILFDFLAHYGLKFYLRFCNKNPQNSVNLSGAAIGNTSNTRVDSEESIENIEVMGGGDAVLSAVIAAWLGWQKLILALIVGFLVGSIIGTIILINEMKKASLLGESIKPTIVGAILGATVCSIPVLILKLTIGAIVTPLLWLSFAAVGAIGGALIGMISVGTKVSKPFPFGPALSLGALVAVFANIP